MARRFLLPALTLAALALFWWLTALQESGKMPRHSRPSAIIASGPAQILLYGGDRFLAANIESIRAAASATDQQAQQFRYRAHKAVSRLNPCHEDNYWIGNASLSWGGAEEEGFELLSNAMHCRYWDEWPAFFYGFNQSFFHKDIARAREVLEMAAQRSSDNAAVFRTFSVMLAAGEIDDTQMVIDMLIHERDKSKDPKLREMLAMRVVRLQGLLTLRNAQASYEQRYKKPLENPRELLASGVLEKLPSDPLKIGYEFRDHTFQLRKMRMQ